MYAYLTWKEENCLYKSEFCFIFKTKLVRVRRIKVRYLACSVRQEKLLFICSNVFTSKFTVSLQQMGNKVSERIILAVSVVSLQNRVNHCNNKQLPN